MGRRFSETNSLQAIRWNHLIKASWSSGNLVVGKLRHDQNSEDLQLISDGLVIHTLYFRILFVFEGAMKKDVKRYPTNNIDLALLKLCICCSPY